MKKKKIISIIIGIIIIIIATITPFRLKSICHEHSLHPEWSLGAWNAVYISALFYCFIISVLTLVLLLINVLKKSKKQSKN